MDEKQIKEALQAVLHPKLKKSLIDIGMIRTSRSRVLWLLSPWP